MSLTMGPHLFQGATDVDRTVELDHIMVADPEETSLAMPTVNVLYGKVLPFARGRTMQDNLANGPHHF